MTDRQFADDLADVIARAARAGVTRLITICSDAADAGAAHALARSHIGIWCTAGIHPHAAGQARPDDVGRIVEFLETPEAVAIGETGLDYHYDNAPRGVQRRLFERHLQLAADLRLPIVVHSRAADEDTIAVIRSSEGEVQGVLHCFAGGAGLLEAGVEAGWMVSFSGMITFKNYTGQDLLRAVPRGQLLVETDSPYLAPVPQRGRRNEPAFVRDVCAAAARIYGIEPEEMAAITTANALRFYGLGADAAQIDSSAEPKT